MPAQLMLPGRRMFAPGLAGAASWKPNPHTSSPAPERIGLRPQRLGRWLQTYFHGSRLVAGHVRNGLILQQPHASEAALFRSI